MGGVANSASQQAWRVARALSGRILAQSESGGNANSVWSPACVANLLAVAREGSAGATHWELDTLLGDGDLLVEPDPLETGMGLRWVRGELGNGGVAFQVGDAFGCVSS